MDGVATAEGFGERGQVAAFADLERNRERIASLRALLEQRRGELHALQKRIADPFALARLEGADRDYGLDPEFRQSTKAIFQFLYDSYWRVKSRGLDNVPTHGGAILIGNHSGGLPFDGTMVSYAVSEIRRPGRVTRLLYDKFVEGMPVVAEFYRRCGAVPARYAVADELLSRDELVAIFPEGTRGTAKLYDQRYKLRSFATSSARLSCRHRVPIVPFAVIGAEEIYPLIGRSTKLGQVVGAPYVPITPFFPFLGPVGLIPLPTKWSIVFGAPVYLYRESRFRGRNREDFLGMAERLRNAVQVLVKGELAKRSSIFLG